MFYCKMSSCKHMNISKYNMKRTTRLGDEKVQAIMYIVRQVTGDSRYVADRRDMTAAHTAIR